MQALQYYFEVVASYIVELAFESKYILFERSLEQKLDI